MESLKIVTFNSGLDSCGLARMDYNCGCFAILAAESGSTGLVLFYFPSGAAGFVWIGQTAAETSTENLASLRLVSWMCFFAAVFLLVGACLWPVLILGAGGVGFLGLFVRVVKNLLAEAIVLKDENDLTI